MSELPKSIKFGLSVKEVQNAIKELKAYQNSLDAKNERFVMELSNLGLEVARSIVVQHTHGSGQTLGSLRVETTQTGEVTSMQIVVESEAILFLEFGSGFRYNSGVGNPYAGKFGMGPGTYPGQTHADDPNGWWYQDETGEWKHSFGMKADMPMYKAYVAMFEAYQSLARQIFSK